MIRIGVKTTAGGGILAIDAETGEEIAGVTFISAENDCDSPTKLRIECFAFREDGSLAWVNPERVSKE